MRLCECIRRVWGDTSCFHTSLSYQSNPGCLCLCLVTHPLFTFPPPTNQTLGVCASKHLQLLTHHCILPQCASKEVEGRHSCTFSRGELLGYVLVVVGVGLEETLSATRILGGWGHRQQTGSSPPRRCYNHTTHWHCTHFLVSYHEYETKSKSDFSFGGLDQLEGSPLIWSRAKTTSQPGKDEMRVNKQSCFQSPGLNLTRKLPSEGSYNLAPTSYYSPALQPY